MGGVLDFTEQIVVVEEETEEVDDELLERIRNLGLVK